MEFVDTNLSLPIPQSPHPQALQPISQAIDALLALRALNSIERGFLLRIKTRNLQLIWADELEAIAQIWQVYSDNPAIF